MPRLIDADDLYRKVVGYNGGAVDKTVAKRLIEQQPTVQRNSTQSNASNTLNALNALDTIYRQAAIDALGEEPMVWCNENEYELGERNQWNSDVLAIKAVPSAQPEIIRCEDCKHGMYDVMCKFYWCHGVAHSANWFCADGERREDE